MAIRLAYHARQRLRERSLPADAITLVLLEPERIDIQDPGAWNERYRVVRHLGGLRIAVVWYWDHDEQVVLTVMVTPARRRGTERGL
ncbi:MAG: DUF4258 domain-containing protein [Actinomycetota bacterium]